MGNGGAKHKAAADKHAANKRAEVAKYAADKRIQESNAKRAAEALQKQYDRDHALKMERIRDENAKKDREAKAEMEQNAQEHAKRMQQMQIDADDRDKNRRIQQKDENLERIKTELKDLDVLIENEAIILETDKKDLEKVTKDEQFQQEFINNFSNYKQVELDKVSDELQIKSAQEKFEFVDKQIKTAIDKTGQTDGNVGNFLTLTHHLLAATVSTTAHSNKLDAEISTFGELINRECQDQLSIEQYFNHKNLKQFIPILASEKFVTLDSLKCEDEEEYIEILSVIEEGVKQEMELKQNNEIKESEEQKSELSETQQLEGADLGKKLLTDWKLTQYWETMEEEGWDDPQYWNELKEEDLKELSFKGGHIRKFKAKMKGWLNKNKLLSLQEKRLLKEICCQPETWEKYEIEQQNAVKEGLSVVSPLLSEFFTKIHEGIKQSQEMLGYEPTLNDMQNRAIKMVNDMPPQIEYKYDETNNDISPEIDYKSDEDIIDEMPTKMEQKANEDIFDNMRREWQIHSKCEIYSDSKKCWFEGEIVGIESDNEEEWLNVQYASNQIKQIGRFSRGIRPSMDSNNKIALQSHALTAASIVSINVTDSMMEQFNQDILSMRALTVAVGVEDCCMQIMKSQGTIRQSVLLAQEILKMRPAHMSDEGKKLWTAVDDGIVRIFKSAINMVRVSAKYFGYFLRFKQSFQFYESNTDKSLMISLQYLKKDCREFTVFKKNFSKTVQELSDEAMNCIRNCVTTAVGAKTFEEYRSSRDATLRNWLDKKAIWDKKALDLDKELDQKQKDKINLSAEKARLTYKVKMLESNIENNRNQKQNYINVQSMLNKKVIYSLLPNPTNDECDSNTTPNIMTEINVLLREQSMIADIQQICYEERDTIQAAVIGQNNLNNGITQYPTTPPPNTSTTANTANQTAKSQTNNSNAYKRNRNSNNGTWKRGDRKDEDDEKRNEKHVHTEFDGVCNNPQCLKIMQQQQIEINRLRAQNGHLRQMNKTLQTDQRKLLVLSQTTLQSQCENRYNPPKNSRHRKNKKKNKKKKIKAWHNQMCSEASDMHMFEPSYEPLSSIRAKGNVQISKVMTKETIASVVGSDKEVNYYKFMDKRLAMELTDNPNIIDKLKNNLTNPKTDTFAIDSAFFEEKGQEPLYCIIETQSAENNVNSRWKMCDELFTAKQVKHRNDKISMPVISSQTKIDVSLGQIDKIRKHLHENYDQIMNVKWRTVPVFSRRKCNKRRTVLRVENGHFNKLIREVKSKPNDTMLMPIVMFNKVDYMIEWVLIVLMANNICIGISFVYNEQNNMPMQVSGLHLEKGLLLEQHCLVSAQHMMECNCLTDWNSCITNIEICDDLNAQNNAIVALKEKYHSLKEFIYRFIDGAPNNNYESMKSDARYLINYHNGCLPMSPSISMPNMSSSPLSGYSSSTSAFYSIPGIGYVNNISKSASASNSHCLQQI